jgi:hypothetical protein
MKNNYYKFITHWQIKAPLNDVWHAIYESTEWPAWWKGMQSVKIIEPNDSNGINGIREYTWKSILPYTLSFKMKITAKEDFKFLQGVAFGELEGYGTWLFMEEHGVTKVQYNWIVKTNKAWMNQFAFLLKPLFKINHDIIMKWGARGLAKKLNATFITA